MNRKTYNIKPTNGSKWIRQDLRVSIIAWRDAVLHNTELSRVCPYCLRTVEDDNISLSLDHITPRIYGGKNDTNNLITCCLDCNTKRGDKIVPQFLREAFEYPEYVIVEIVRYINRQRVKPVNRQIGKQFLQVEPLSYWSNA